MTSIPSSVGPVSGSISGVMLVMVAAGLWATVGVAVQMTPEVALLSDTALAAARTGIGGLALLAVWRFGLGGRLAALRGLNLQSLAVFAVASAIFQTCLFRAFDELGVTVAVCLTVCLPPILGVAWAAVCGERLSPTAVLALAVALVGMGLVAAGGAEAGQGGLGLMGLVYGCVASVAFVVMSFVAADMARNAPAMVVAGAGLMLSALLLSGLVLLAGDGAGAGPGRGHAAGDGPDPVSGPVADGAGLSVLLLGNGGVPDACNRAGGLDGRAGPGRWPCGPGSGRGDCADGRGGVSSVAGDDGDPVVHGTLRPRLPIRSFPNRSSLAWPIPP